MSGLEGPHTEFGCFSKASEKAIGRFEACFYRTKSHTLLSAIAPQGLTHTHAALVLRTASQLPAQEGPWLSRTELCEMQISEPACPRAQDIVLQSKETCSSFLSPCPRLMLLPSFLLAEMASHPKGEERPQATPFFSCQKLTSSPCIMCLWAPSTSDSKAETQKNTFPGLSPMEEIAPPRAGATQGSRPNDLCQV